MQLKRKLGKTDLEFLPLAFGANVFSWTVDEALAFRLLDSFVDQGFSLLDTANVYSRWAPGSQDGASEAIIGRWIHRSKKRHKVLVATKVGMEMNGGQKGLSKNYILRAVEESLLRLQIETIDVYQAHCDDPSTPLEETLDAFATLVREGKVRYIGVSNFTAKRLQEALAVSQRLNFPRVDCVQPLYNLYERKVFEESLAGLCARESLGVLPYFSLAAGFLTGKYRSVEDGKKSVRGQANVARFLNERGQRILASMDIVAQETGSPLAAIAIAWLLSRPTVSAAIASATSLDQLATLVEGSRLQLTANQLQLLEQASSEG